jgi:uncharacterized membrane protein (DUF4010 family)
MASDKRTRKETNRPYLKSAHLASATLKKFFITALFLLLSLVTSAASLASETVRLSSTIGPIDAGIVPLLAQAYEKKTPFF